MAERKHTHFPYPFGRWRRTVSGEIRSVPPIETVCKGKIRTEIMIAGRCYRSDSVLTLPRVRFLEGE
ncbi:MAG: hypothetical protein JO051_03305 [Acidobacteriaceae bacterium]|nr:hypothetical protein [Acidobacteriaceae bacterium]